MRFNWNLAVTMEKVDIDKLEREMLDALRADRKYSRENDAKFRAVNQRVQTYEEFRCVLMYWAQDQVLWTIHTCKLCGGGCDKICCSVVCMNTSHIHTEILSRHHIWPHSNAKSYLTRQETSHGI